MSYEGAYRRRRRKREDSDFDDFFESDGNFWGEIDEKLKVRDPSVEFYPQPYCDIVDSELIVHR